MEKKFDGEKPQKLGTEKKPAKVHVQTIKRQKEVESIFKQHGWAYSIECRPDKPENVSDLEILMSPSKTLYVEKKIGRNEPCPCGSGKKYKQCCGK
jgi:SWIM/SEC-C metal-binding protein